MQHTILRTVSKSKRVTREALRSVIYAEHPDATRFNMSYGIRAAIDKGYLKKNNPTAKQWDKHETYSLTTLGKTRLKLLDLKAEQEKQTPTH